MFDPRIYRAGFLPALAAIVVLMFSLEPVPEPLDPPLSAPTFQGRETARLARSIADLAPSRTPGSNGDAAVAGLVQETFGAIEGGEVAVQEFESSFEGGDVLLQNVVLTLPGQSEEVLLVVADRDSPVGQGATASAAATATLLSIAEDLGGARHERTIVLASTAGGSTGAAGVRRLAEELPTAGAVEAGIVISAPGVEDPMPPFVVPGRDGSRSTSAQLLATADAIATTQFGEEATDAGTVQEFARLAIPLGVGSEVALADAGIETVAISANGERAPEPDRGSIEQVSADTIFAAGTSALGLLLTLDEAREPISVEPGSYVRVGDNLLPGWTLALLALTLVLPSLLAAGDVWLRDRRRSPRATARSIPWAIERCLLPLTALLAVYGLGLVGLLPDTGYPYDPARFPPGADGPIALGAICLAVLLVALLIRPFRTPLDTEPQTLAAAAGLLSAFGLIGVWVFNPFLALCLVPTAHVWLLPARPQGPVRPVATALVSLLALVPALIVVGELAGALGLGYSVAWHLLLWLSDGPIGLGVGLSLCLLIGGLLATIAAGRGSISAAPTPRRSVLGPSGHAGPGALGGVPSSLPRR